MTQPLRYTSDPPTEPGWYWVKPTVNDPILGELKGSPVIVQAYEDNGELLISWPDNSECLGSETPGTTHWAGPIPQPEEER